MVYIYKKNVGNKNYYYLRLSKREGKKVIAKDVAYLGDNISDVKKNLDNLKNYQKEIRKANKSINKFLNYNYFLEKIKLKKIKTDKFIQKDILEEIEAIKLHYNKEFDKLNNKTKKEIYKTFLIDFAFNTTSIEGNTITLKEAQKLLEENLLPKDKTLREVYDLQNTEKVFFWLLDKSPKINEKLLIKIHDDLLNKIDDRKGYRISEIRVLNSTFDATPTKYIKTDIKELINWFEFNKKFLHPLVLATLFHHKLEKIHPFYDGNGRTGRMILNYILIKNKYPPLIIKKKNRNEYLNSLSNADLGKNEEIIEFICSEMIESYWNNFIV